MHILESFTWVQTIKAIYATRIKQIKIKINFEQRYEIFLAKIQWLKELFFYTLLPVSIQVFFFIIVCGFIITQVVSLDGETLVHPLLVHFKAEKTAAVIYGLNNQFIFDDVLVNIAYKQSLFDEGSAECLLAWGPQSGYCFNYMAFYHQSMQEVILSGGDLVLLDEFKPKTLSKPAVDTLQVTVNEAILDTKNASTRHLIKLSEELL